LIFIGNTKEYLHIELIEKQNNEIFMDTIENGLAILWCESGINEFIIDGKHYVFRKNEIVFLTEFHKVDVKNIERIRLLRFNRPFFCILDHDAEVGCKGILFFGASQLPIIKIPDEEIEKFDTLWKMFTIEMKTNDNLQIDMLQMMLKRYLILCTRLYKLQMHYPKDDKESYIVREFNFLVEQHFKTKHTMAEYAKLLNKSPKTISNIFSKIGSKTPMQYLQNRKMIEARRLLHYTNKQIKEIAYEIGYDEVQAFSRFFKKQERISPSEFKKNGIFRNNS
jgi:AraC-like DNA-binding protein